MNGDGFHGNIDFHDEPLIPPSKPENDTKNGHKKHPRSPYSVTMLASIARIRNSLKNGIRHFNDH